MTESRRERADAIRNRWAILRATEELLAEHGPEQVTMEQVAAAAGVGKGTVFHRFGSRQGLMRALMEARAHALREEVVSGPPPLGPGARPRERLLAFVDGVVTVVARNKGLVAALGHAMTTTPRQETDSREGHPVYEFWHGHIATLLGEQRPDLDADMLAHVLLAPLASSTIVHLLQRGEGDRVAGSLRTLVIATLDARP